MDLSAFTSLVDRLKKLDPTSVASLHELVTKLEAINVAIEPAEKVISDALGALVAAKPELAPVKEVLDILGKLDGPALAAMDQLLTIAEKLTPAPAPTPAQ